MIRRVIVMSIQPLESSVLMSQLRWPEDLSWRQKARSIIAKHSTGGRRKMQDLEYDEHITTSPYVENVGIIILRA